MRMIFPDQRRQARQDTLTLSYFRVENGGISCIICSYSGSTDPAVLPPL